MTKHHSTAELTQIAAGLTPNAQILLGYLHAQREWMESELGNLQEAAQILVAKRLAHIDDGWVQILPKGDEVMLYASMRAISTR